MSTIKQSPKTPAAIRVIEMVGESKENWSDAARLVIEKASITYKNITGLDVLHQTAVVRDGKIVEYHTNVKIAFLPEPASM
ncbi:dodecin domain-containing protein [Telmatocola sphagniphila]|uniref:Dodecin domain-containing protein n=1 Tax=Telmatocola sphagniphila TaxID=1123043 RepID=A0A8E6EWQ7_9BACT|nr:dodecin family protein [Telmatocola sphagniphila]QVL34042.1 dodecin domain-containing protein [Telmatocola sphagniphila]